MRTVVTTVTVTDDLGGPGEADTFRFTHDGVDYEIDLNKRNAETFQRRIEALYGPYVAAARDVTPASRAVPSKQAIRAWAAENGHEVASRGRIPAEIVEAYEVAQGGTV